MQDNRWTKRTVSTESQIEFCKYELKGGGNCKEYTDRYSGKNTDRPKFQELEGGTSSGLDFAKSWFHKLDCIKVPFWTSTNMMELFQQYNVEFVSLYGSLIIPPWMGGRR